jgi:hypothetical protein
VLDPKIKVEKLVAETKFAKWKWQMNTHFEQCYIMSIIDGSRKCPKITNSEKASEDDKKNLLAWKRDNTQTVGLIASALSQPVADLAMTYSDTREFGTTSSVCRKGAVFD